MRSWVKEDAIQISYYLSSLEGKAGFQKWQEQQEKQIACDERNDT
ncbi:MAG: hypothetical protein ACRKFN_00010 [Desulfitobacterium sp.]